MVAPKALNRVTSMQRWNVPKNDWQCCGESTTSPWRMAKNGNFWMVKNGSFTEFHRVSHAEIVIHDVECGFIWFKTG
jgi:hypothetical protein